ncbi:MAG: M56 family metallopeptidase [Oscillospiraceae bacterium]|nr:M56 family metallopeptidase [Oscillospiraceae bacterium]
MDKLFLTVLNMSITGAFVVAAICLVRLSIKKAPKIISYCLWAVAWFRLAFPLSIESVFSLIPFNAQIIPPDIATQPAPRIDSGIPFLNNAFGNVLIPPQADIANIATSAANATNATNAASVANVNFVQFWTVFGSWAWFVGTVFLLVLGAASYARLKHKLGSAIRIDNEHNLYETDCIRSPFVSGAFNPKIYIPLNLSGQERDYIILHEQTHIRRFDHIIKFLAYFILCFHWFNPFAWAAFLLMSVDMEMSCDERVLKELGGEIKKDYSMSLLSLAVGQPVIGGLPLAFGDDGIKKRIKNVMNFKKSSRVAVALAIVLVTIISFGLVLSRVSNAALLESSAAAALGSGGNSRGDESDGESDNGGSDGGESVESGGESIGGENVDGDSGNSDSGESIDGAGDSSGGGSIGSVGGYGQGTAHAIADYYNNEDGDFSALGLALDEDGSERTLTVNGGDTLIAGDRRYEVIVDSLALSFYTQPSHEQVVLWWIDYLDSWVESGKLEAMD